jgi:DNA processing protein
VPTSVRTPLWCPAKELPGQLGKLAIPVEGLWLLGDRSCLDVQPNHLVAIVGTREASAYGIRMTQRIAAGAARAGMVVVSGMARGIDAAAHEAAVAAGGRTIAVLGTGVDVPYPVGHRTLHQLVQGNGLVISEMEPGTRAFPGCFPRRNRIIAGLCVMIVVVEAGFRSGALNTANVMEQLGRPIGVVPGQADDPRAAGSNQLMRDGAHVILGFEDVLTVLEISTSSHTFGSEQGTRDRVSAELWDPMDRVILGALETGTRSVAGIAEMHRVSVRQVSEALLRLELLGVAQSDGGGYRLGVGL